MMIQEDKRRRQQQTLGLKEPKINKIITQYMRVRAVSIEGMNQFGGSDNIFVSVIPLSLLSISLGSNVWYKLKRFDLLRLLYFLGGLECTRVSTICGSAFWPHDLIFGCVY